MPPKSKLVKIQRIKQNTETSVVINTKHTVVVDIAKYYLLGTLTILLILVFLMIIPFLPSLIIASVIATGAYPLYSKLVKFSKKPNLSAFLLSFSLLVLIITPLSWFIAYITKEAFETYLYLQSEVTKLIGNDFTLIPQMVSDSFLGKYLDKYGDFVTINPSDIIQYATILLQNISEFLIDKTTSFAKQISLIALHSFVLLISTFFFFRDGEKIVSSVKDLIPLPKRYRETVVQKLHDISQGILFGVFGASIAQGILGGIGMAIAGVQNAVFWGTIMAIFSVVPYIGSSVIWIPMVLSLLFTGHYIAAIFFAIWCMFIVGTVDNFVKPLLIGEKANIHPLLTFITIFGGIFVFGVSGVIIAPYILSLLLAFIHIYELEYKKVLDE